MHEVAILIIAFNRPSLLEQQLILLSKMQPNDSLNFLSVDGPREGRNEDLWGNLEIKKVVEKLNKQSKLTYRFENMNRGCDSHIPLSIDWVFSKSSVKGVIVIEDDVIFTISSLAAIINRLKVQISSNMIEPVISMSGLTRANRMSVTNFWRYSPYFSAWGYGITSEFWRQYRNFKIESEKPLDSILSEHITLPNFSKRRKKIWSERINRGNYDYSIQKFLFSRNIGTIAPVFRIADNVGHGDTRSTHTRFPRPKYLTKPVWGVKFEFQEQFCRSRLLTWLDSNSWAGDGLLSKRGRNVGFRSGIRNLRSVFLKSEING